MLFGRYVLTAECVKTFTGHQDGVVCVAFGRENQVLSASMDCSAKACRNRWTSLISRRYRR